MGVRVAYGLRDDIDNAIKNDVIPKDCIVITEDGAEPEMFFYDIDGNLKPIEERNRFVSLSEARAWVQKYGCAGHIFSIQNGTSWVPYIVQEDGTLSTITGEATVVDNIHCIDGGTAADLVGI